MGRDERANRLVGGIGGGGLPPAQPSIVRDALGRGLAEGDLVFIDTGKRAGYRIDAISPVVDPSVPNAHQFLDVTLSTMVRFRCAKNVANQEFVRVAEAHEIGGTPKPSAAEPPPSESSSEQQQPKAPALEIVRQPDAAEDEAPA